MPGIIKVSYKDKRIDLDSHLPLEKRYHGNTLKIA